MVIQPTPLRSRDVPLVDGCHVLGRPDIEWLDGSEDDLYRRVLAAADLSSRSDELAESARTWPEHYHLSTARANVVRPFLFRPEHRVLEVGAGCGAVTRWLGEQCGLVDALEPVQQRARVARARTRDLESVEVFVGEVGGIPREQAYDVVVVVGVLEYVGAGTADPGPYVAFLDGLRGLLAPGGRLLLAIENKLGVKYLAGAPEDHTNRVFDSVEGYPVGSPARTFSRRELTELVLQAGFESSRVFGAFPDYKLTRLIHAEEAAVSTPALLRHLPTMPSPDWVTPRPALADEALLWGTFVDAGLAMDVANSLVVVAGARDGADSLWPEDVLATYYSVGRRAPFVMRSDVRRLKDDVVIDRRPEHPELSGVDWLRLRSGRERVARGMPLADVVPAGDEEALLRSLSAWFQVVVGLDAPERHLDAVPHNLVFDHEPRLIDDEWECDRSTLGHIVGRGLFYLVDALARQPLWAGIWAERRVEDVVRDLAERLAIDIDDSWPILEIEVQSVVLQTHKDATNSALDERLRAAAARTIVNSPDGWLRDFERYGPWLAAERDHLAAENSALNADAEEMARVLQSRNEKIRTIVEDRWYRAGERYRSAVTAIAPPGTRRRKAYAAVRRWKTSSS
jgi:2-polyprenyl-3-methyl-5-hydroxy-6-metoxy-1,4-benzoquinol methylase